MIAGKRVKISPARENKTRKIYASELKTIARDHMQQII
tara:strand:- start:282 stop:395 length:114 start_codon:yes stop_codon:yes gene_type:complete